MKRGMTGRYVEVSTIGEKCQAYVPDPLPPHPAIEYDSMLRTQMDRTILALGRLDELISVLPDPALFLYMYVRKEAVLSSQIEGTQSSLSDLLLFELDEIPGVPLDDVQEASHYVAAVMYGLDKMKDGMPLSNRLLKEIHGVLLSGGRGSTKSPGEYRRTQNWIGGTRPGDARFVPPPAEYIPEGMGLLEKFLHDDPVPTPVLIKAALAHVQFETIHPFLDGNGRMGRLLVVLILANEGILRAPILYPSLYLKTHRGRYYDLLQSVRVNGNWEEWLEFFLTAVGETAEQGIVTAHRLMDLFQTDRATLGSKGRISGSVLRIHDILRSKPIVSISWVHQKTGLSVPTVTSALGVLIAEGMVREITGRRRRRLFAYDKYIAILNEGTEPIVDSRT
ncbi:MAG: Fic family protein [candidate division Zixibacteria bacterium]|nr:Fic family protein [candidate division Zixibacteria bacterium]